MKKTMDEGYRRVDWSFNTCS